jgi:membrane protein DedA with SNARE-associated domain
MDLSQLASDFLEVVSRLPSPVVYCTIVGILLICGLGVPVPEDITLLVAGLLAASGKISLTGGMIAGFVGVLSGDMILFLLGRKLGKRVFSLPGLRRIFTPPRIEAAERRIRANGPFICFIARFLPGLRSAIFATSGALGVRLSTFLLLDGLAALLSVPLWVYVGYWFGTNFEDALGGALAKAETLQIYLFSGLGIVILGYVAYKLWCRRRKAGQLPQV